MDAYATHLEVLVETALATKDGILELGCGNYSSPVLNAIAKSQGRVFKSQASDRMWASKFPYVEVINWLEWTPPEGKWGMVFLDSEESRDGRLNRLAQLATITNTVVLHDADSGMRSEAWANKTACFGSVVVYDKHIPKTAVLRVKSWLP